MQQLNHYSLFNFIDAWISKDESELNLVSELVNGKSLKMIAKQCRNKNSKTI